MTYKLQNAQSSSVPASFSALSAQRLLACILSLLLLIAFPLSAQATVVAPSNEASEEEPLAFVQPQALFVYFADDFFENTICVGDFAFHYYTELRIEELDSSALENTEPISFGPWIATSNYHANSAPDDGGLSEWDSNYYITHDWSAYGQDILSMLPNDSVTINGHTVHVERIFNYPKESYYEELVEIWGDGGTILQTCLPNRDMNRIVCAR